MVVVGLLSATLTSIDRWQAETQKLRSQAEQLQQQSAGELDEVRKAELNEASVARLSAIPSPANVRWRYVFLSAMLYGIGLLPPGIILHRCLVAMRVPSTMRRATAAQLIGHVAKYVPGKALVVVLRVNAILPKSMEVSRRPIGRAAVCVFLETLLMMGVGAVVAGLLLWNTPLPTWVRVTAVIMAVGSMIPLSPPILRQILAVVEKRRAGSEQSHLVPSDSVQNNHADTNTADGITWSLLATCGIASLISWLCIGTSFALLISAIPSWQPPIGLSESWLQSISFAATATAAISLGMVLGFASLLPGGAGVREYVTLLVLTPVIGSVHALLSVIAARLMFVTVEAILASLAWIYLRRFSSNAP